MKHTLYYFLFFTLVCLVAQGQDNPNGQLATREDSITAAIDVNLAEYLPPLSLLIEVAIENSPELDMAYSTSKQLEYQLALTKKDWTNFVSIGAQYRYGAVSGGGVSNSQALLFPEDLSVGAFAFLSVRVPLNYFVARQDEIRAAEIGLDIQKSKQLSQSRAIEQVVVETYNRLLLIQKLINISSEAKQSADLIYEMSIERFRDGELGLDQLGANTSLKAKYAAEYASLKMEFSITYLELERLMGMPISKLQKTQN